MYFNLLMSLFCILLGSVSCLEVELSARSAILMNADTGDVLFEKEAYLPAYPASTTKLATALFVLDGKKSALEQDICISSDALQMKLSDTNYEVPYRLETGGTMMGLRKGEILSLEALLHGMLMVSGNDAANAIAHFHSGSVATFVEEMNDYLLRIGCQRTNYLNPHGLHHPEHKTTAYDLALIMQKGLTIPKFRELISKTSYCRPKSNKSPKGEIVTFNQLLKPGKHYYQRAIGGKTGYHSQSMATLVAAAHHDGRTLIAVVLGCSKAARYTDIKHLFEAAFREEPVKRILLEGNEIFSHTIEGAQSLLCASLEEPLAISYFPSEEPECRAFLHWDSLLLPIQKGQRVGEVQVIDQKSRLLIKAPLFAKKALKGTWSFRLKHWIFGN
ncbi:MAG: D-alanyl-D-alanine carboxypeptidase [Chlamydiae bacterium]|nr:D-alanyl-D-alanine carboxypeptidase [Chlamydiota bacterium]